MRTLIHDKKYNFKYMFDTETGAYLRTGILDEHGKDTGVDPFMGSFPHLIDVGIMGHCIHGKTGLCVKAGIGCYQSGLLIEKPNMRYEDFESIVEQCKDKVNQFALGGAAIRISTRILKRSSNCAGRTTSFPISPPRVTA